MAYVPGVLGKMKICVIIPVYNESEEIKSLVAALKAKNLDVLVVDDGSSDDSGLMAQEKGAIVLRHQNKSGKGVSLRDGFGYALEYNYEGVITMDGDGQHDAQDIDTFIRRAQENPHCVIAGSRMVNPRGMPWLRFLTNKIMSWMISMICRQRIPDTQCGYRFIGRSVLERIHLTSSDFEIETEVLIKASKQGFKVDPVSIKTIYRDERSKINPFLDTFRFFAYLIKEACAPKS